MKIVDFKPTLASLYLGLAVCLSCAIAAPLFAANDVPTEVLSNDRDGYPRGRVGGGTY